MAKTDNLNRERKRELALEMYLNTDKTQKEICEIVGWTEKTFSDNKEKGQWESLKGAATITSQNIIKKLYLKLEKLVDEEDINADKLIKVAKSIEMMSNRKVTVSNHINCAKEFITWLLARDPEQAKKLNNFQKQFINELVSNG